MMVYIDMRFFKEKHLIYLKESMPQVTFITEKEHAYEAEVAIVTPPFVHKDELIKFKKLKWIQLLTAGFDNADLLQAKKRSIIVTNAQDVFSIQIAEDIVSKILIFNRQIKGQVKHMEQGLWKHIPITHELKGSTVGILGTGSIGKETAKRLKNFDVNILGYRQKKEKLPYFNEIYTDEKGLDLVLKQSDYIVIGLPLNKKTFHLINESKLNLMKKDAVLINVARGEIIDQDALLNHIKKRNLRGVGLDVTTPEPLPQNHELWHMPQVYITPHNASASPYMSSRLLEAVVVNLKRYHTKKKLNYIIT